MSDTVARHGRRLGLALLLLGSGFALGGCALLDLLPPLPPDQAPTGVRASLGQLDDEILITWTAVARATEYHVFRADAADGTYDLIGVSPSPSYIDTAVDRGRLYWYRVAACNEAGCGPRSPAVPGYAGFPPAPTNVQASDGTPHDRIVITWDPVPGATYYQVFRDRVRDGAFRELVGETRTNRIEDPTARAGIGYWYVVRACVELPARTACSHLSAADQGYRGVLVRSADAPDGED